MPGLLNYRILRYRGGPPIYNHNNIFFQQILNSFPDNINFTMADERTAAKSGVAFMDAYMYQQEVAPYQLQIGLYDKRREKGFKDLTVLQYTHNTSFMNASIKNNILTGQYHRFINLITEERALQVELGISLAKLIIVCGMPRNRLLKTLRRLMYSPETRYLHTTHKPGYHYMRVMFWLQYAEQHGIAALVKEAQRAKPRGAAVQAMEE